MFWSVFTCYRFKEIGNIYSLYSPLRLWNMDPVCGLWKRDPDFQNQAHEEVSPYLLLRAQDQRLDAEQDQLPCGVNSNLFWQLSGYKKLHGSGMSHAMTASPKISIKTSSRVGDAVIGKGNAGWTMSKSEHICPCQNCSQGPPAEKTGGWSLLNRPSSPPNDPIGQGTEVNWTHI